MIPLSPPTEAYKFSSISNRIILQYRYQYFADTSATSASVVQVINCVYNINLIDKTLICWSSRLDLTKNMPLNIEFLNQLTLRCKAVSTLNSILSLHVIYCPQPHNVLALRGLFFSNARWSNCYRNKSKYEIQSNHPSRLRWMVAIGWIQGERFVLFSNSLVGSTFIPVLMFTSGLEPSKIKLESNIQLLATTHICL